MNNDVLLQYLSHGVDVHVSGPLGFTAHQRLLQEELISSETLVCSICGHEWNGFVVILDVQVTSVFHVLRTSLRSGDDH